MLVSNTVRQELRNRIETVQFMLGWNRFLAHTSLTELFCLRCLPTASVIPVLPDKQAYNLNISYPDGLYHKYWNVFCWLFIYCGPD
jgi:hypothetical protein